MQYWTITQQSYSEVKIMSRKVESLKRLYKAGRMTAERLQHLKNVGEITQIEYEYIIVE